MKRGLNYLDVNTLKFGLQSGWSVETIAQHCHTYPDVIQKYMDSMGEEAVAELKAQAPADGLDMTALKAQLKAEIIAEMREEAMSEPAVEDELEGAFEFEEVEDVAQGQEDEEAEADSQPEEEAV
jgi:hypothetical protein